MDLIQDFNQDINLPVDGFFSKGSKTDINKLIKDEGDKYRITSQVVNRYTAAKLLGNDTKFHKLFIEYSPSKGMVFYKFFTFEVIRLFETILSSGEKVGYDANRLEAIVEYFREDTQSHQEDIDREHIKDVFEFNILPHQEEAIKKYLDFKYIVGYRGMLFHGAIGSGKSISACFIMEGLHKVVDKVVIICPLPTLYDVWDKTLSGNKGTGFKSPQSRYIVKSNKPYNGEKYIICHYEGLDKLEDIIKSLPKGKTGVIIDECHNLNETKSKRTQLAMQLVEDLKTKDIILLSGTPIKSGFRELGSILTFLDERFKGKIENAYYAIYSSPTNFMQETLLERYNGYATVVKKDVVQLEPIETINLKLRLPENKIAPYYLSNIRANLREYIKTRLKEIKDNIKYWHETYHSLKMKGLEANPNVKQKDIATYEDNVNRIKSAKSTFFVNAERFKFANEFEKKEIMPYLSKDEKVLFKDAKTIFKYPALKVIGEALGNVIGKARIDCHAMMAEYIDYSSIILGTKKKTIVFSNYIEVCDKTMGITKKIGFKPIGVFGESTKDLVSSVDKFGKDGKTNPLVTTYKSLSTGVPLIMADTIICIDLPFRMYQYEQAIGRAWRLGQDSNVRVYIAEIESSEPTINSRGIDIISFFNEEVEKITGVPASVNLKGDDMNIATEDIEDILEPEDNIEVSTENISQEGILDFFFKKHEEEKMEFDFFINARPDAEYEEMAEDGGQSKVDYIYGEIFGEDKDDSFLNIVDWGVWFNDYKEDKDYTDEEKNRIIKEIKEELDNDLKRIKTAYNNLNKPKYKTEPYTVKVEEMEEHRLRNEAENYKVDSNGKVEILRDVPEEIVTLIKEGLEKVYKEYNHLFEAIMKKGKLIKPDISNESHIEVAQEAINPKRQAVQDFILKYIKKIVTGDENYNLYVNLFKSMDDKEFDKFMNDLKDGKNTLSVIIPNGSNTIKVSIENNIKIAKELGYDFFQRVKVGATHDLPAYTTPNKYMILKLPVRRAAQLLSKKISIPEDSKRVDLLTGQVTNASKGSKLTNPELQILLGLGLKKSIVELMKHRGGDLGSGNAMNAMLFTTGVATQEQADRYSTKVESTKTLKAYLQAMHIRSTL